MVALAASLLLVAGAAAVAAVAVNPGRLFAAPSDKSVHPSYRILAASTYSAFQCSALASRMRNTSEQQRLFKYGYSLGMRFLNVLQERGMSENEIAAHAAPIPDHVLEGPSTDFVLGRLYADTEVKMISKIEADHHGKLTEDGLRLAAEGEFRARNCSLIGLGGVDVERAAYEIGVPLGSAEARYK